MNSLAYIPASDGAANASLMTVTDVRSGGATTIQVNTVANVPTKFYASYGTPHTFTDPVTGETITVISEATAVDFAGHIDGSNVEIDEIAPGYTDNGNEVGDIIVIRPVTEWANNIFNTLSEIHEDDGTLKDDVVDEAAVIDRNVTKRKVDAGSIYPLTISTSAFGTSYGQRGTVTIPAADLPGTGNYLIEVIGQLNIDFGGSNATKSTYHQIRKDGSTSGVQGGTANASQSAINTYVRPSSIFGVVTAPANTDVTIQLYSQTGSTTGAPSLTGDTFMYAKILGRVA